MRKRSVALIAASVFSLLGIGSFYLQRRGAAVEQQQLEVCVAEIQALNTIQKPAKELLRIQTLIYGERDKRETLNEVYVATEKLQCCTEEIEQLLHSAEPPRAEELKQRLNSYARIAVAAKCALSREEQTFNWRDTQARTWAIRDLYNDQRVQICTSILSEDLQKLLEKLPRTTVPENSPNNPLATYKPTELEHIIGLPQQECLREVQATLYARGIEFAKKTMPQNTSTANLLSTCCGFLMVDIGTNQVYESNPGLALFGKTRYELLLADLATQHGSTHNIENTAAIYTLASRAFNELPAKQLLHILCQSQSKIENLDTTITIEVNAMQKYEPRSKNFKQESIRARKTLNDALLQYNKLLRELQESEPEAFK